MTPVPDPASPSAVTFRLDGSEVTVPDDGSSLLEALRDRVGRRSAKDGCSPQGQCGCCTVLVDGQPRVACVTPVSRVRDRTVTTLDGLDPDVRGRWADALCATGGSQCGFCTPGIVVRLAAHAAAGPLTDHVVDQALLAHMCRCTGWQTIKEAVALVESGTPVRVGARPGAEHRAALEGRSHQVVAPDVALGGGGFVDDRAPIDALVAVLDRSGSWVVAETLIAARTAAGKVQGRRTTQPIVWPITVPDGEWARTLQTTWVEPAYLEPDAVWCAPGGEPTGPLANGGAFGGKVDGADRLRTDARRLADQHARPVRLVLAREDIVRRGPKRPPLAGRERSYGTGVVSIARTPGIAAAITTMAPGLSVEEVDVVGPATSVSIRAAGWAEVAVLLASLGDDDEVRSPDGASAAATIDHTGDVHVRVTCGAVLDEVVLRSYCIGAAHMALGWVRSEAISVDDAGEIGDLTMRSFGVLRAVDTPVVYVTIDEAATGAPVNGSDAVFAAVAAAAWRHEAAGGAWPERWPTRR